MSGITIIKASAGSGKTYRITSEFLKLIIPRPEAYRHILAVTFTNKATAEMKARLLTELHALSKGEPSGHLETIRATTSFSDEKISRQATIALRGILHRYSDLQITTLDSFFQSIIRQLVYELGITGYNRIEVQNDEIIHPAIENLLTASSSDAELLNYLSGLTLAEIRDGKGWDLRKSLYNLANESTKEQFRAHYDAHPQLFDREHILGFGELIRTLIEEFETHLSGLGREGQKVIHSAGLTTDDFVQKNRGPAGFFSHLANRKSFRPNAYTLRAVNQPNQWYSKQHPRKQLIETLADTSLIPLLNKILAFSDAHGKDYNTAKVIQKGLAVTGLINDIRQFITQEYRSQNVFLLSEGGYLLKSLIRETDSPFIYEKTGNWYKNLFIDEFQDTSGIQYENLKPLMLEAVSQGNSCILVGDAKQSIYRWRNSDWSIFVHQAKKDFDKWQPVEHVLPVNWRSADAIVRFNNALYTYAPGVLHSTLEEKTPETLETNNDITTIYTDSAQEVSPPNKSVEGLVSLWFEDKEDGHQADNLLDVFLYEYLSAFRRRVCVPGKQPYLCAEKQTPARWPMR